MTTDPADFLVIDEIARKALKSGDSLRLTMGSESMAFALPHGCRVTVRWVPPERLRRGHIVAVRRLDSYWQIHRLARRPKGGRLMTKSDLFGRDPGSASIDEYLGVITEVEHPIGSINLETIRGRLTERLLRIATTLVLWKRMSARRAYERLRLRPQSLFSGVFWNAGLVYGISLLNVTGLFTPEIAAIYTRRTYTDEPLEIGASDIDTTFILKTPCADREATLRKIAVRFRILRNLCPLFQHTEIFFRDEFEPYASSTLFHALTLPYWKRRYGAEVRSNETNFMPVPDSIVVEEAALLRRIEDVAYDGVHGAGNSLTRNYHLWKILCDSLRVMLLREFPDRLTQADRRALFARRESAWTVAKRVSPERVAPLLNWETKIPAGQVLDSSQLFMLINSAVRFAVCGALPKFNSLADLHAWAYARREYFSAKFKEFTDEPIRLALAALSRNNAATEPIIYTG